MKPGISFLQSRAHLVFYGVIPLVLFWVSCSSTVSPPSTTEQESANRAIEILHQDKQIFRAFDRLMDWSYSRYEFTETIGSNHYLSSTNLVRMDTTGNPFLITGSIASDSLSDIIRAILPEDAPYLLERFKDDFIYEITSDTSYWSLPATKIKIVSRLGSDQDLITATYIYDRATNQLVHVRYQSFHSTILTKEQSSYQIQLRPVGTVWVPYQVSMNVSLQLPFGKLETYGRHVTFYNYTLRSSG